MCRSFVELMLSSFSPLPLPMLHTSDNIDVDSVAAGDTLTAVVTTTGKGIIWGTGLPGVTIKVPAPIAIPQPIQSISLGQAHCAAVTTDGKCYSWGYGSNGALGHGTKSNVEKPKLIAAMSKLVVLQVSCGAYHTGIIAAPKAEVTYLRIVPACDGNTSSEAAISEEGKLLCNHPSYIHATHSATLMFDESLHRILV